MVTPAFASIDDYIGAQPAHRQHTLRQLCDAIRKAVPRAEEGISYQMPTWKLHGEPVIYVAGWKTHYSIYPASKPVVDAFGDELSHYVVEKGTIRFPFGEPVPLDLVARIAKVRAREAIAKGAGKSGRKP